MMLILLIYSYAIGVRSSRKIAQRLESDLVYLYISGLQRPDFRTISDFRKHHLPLFKSLFKRVVMLCHQLGMVSVGHIAIDGTKLDASASRSQRFTAERLAKLEQEVEEQLQQVLDAAEAIDREEDTAYGANKQGNELPDELADKRTLQQKIQEAKRYLEQRELSKVNLTDLDSRVMKTGSGGWEDGYNAQVAVDAQEQIIVAADVVTDQHDKHQFIPIYEQTIENLAGVIPDEVSADAGYASNAVYEYIDAQGITRHLFLINSFVRKSGAVRNTFHLLTAETFKSIQRRENSCVLNIFRWCFSGQRHEMRSLEMFIAGPGVQRAPIATNAFQRTMASTVRFLSQRLMQSLPTSVVFS